MTTPVTFSPCLACRNARQLVTKPGVTPAVAGCVGCGRCFRVEHGPDGVYLIALPHAADAMPLPPATSPDSDADDTTLEYLEPEDEEC